MPQTDQDPSQQLIVIVILVLSKLPIYLELILNIKPENLRRITSIKHMISHKKPHITNCKPKKYGFLHVSPLKLERR